MSLVDWDIIFFIALPSSSSILVKSVLGLKLSIDDDFPMIFAKNFLVCECGLLDERLNTSFSLWIDLQVLAPKIRSRIFPLGPSWRLKVSSNVA